MSKQWAMSLLLGALSAVAAGQTAEVVHSFVTRDDGPSLPLIEASDGRLIGVDQTGGPYAYGEVFALMPDGLGGFDYTSLYTFKGGTDGRMPNSGLVRGPDNLLYGITYLGESLEDHGKVYRLDENGGNVETVAELPGAFSLMLADDENFYVVTYAAIFRMNTSGAVTTLSTFDSIVWPDSYPLAQGGDGALYGTYRVTTPGGGHGGIFRVTLDGDYSVAHSFNGTDGSDPEGLMRSDEGNLYGTTGGGGLHGNGVIFRIDTAGAFSIAYHASETEGLGLPLSQGSDGRLYGSSYAGSNGYGSIFRFDPAGTFETLASFSAPGVEGYGVSWWLEAADGNFYGVAAYGGPAAFGTVVRFDSPNLESIHDFLGLEGGAFPFGKLFEAADGWIYGAAPYGERFNLGSIFRLDTEGAFETFHFFAAGEGHSAADGPIPAGSTDLYGTAAGGSNDLGTFYRVDAGGSLTVLHDFASDDGGIPYAIIHAADGNFYGLASSGVLRIDTSGGVTILAPWESLPGNPQLYLTEGPDGAIYGATRDGGAHEQGTIFRVGLDGAVSTLHEFTGSDGSLPNGGLLALNDGYLYGTTLKGAGVFDGLNHATGTVFRVNLVGDFETLYAFSGADAGDGDYCNGDLVEGSDGYIYGTTAGYPGSIMGTVFRVDKAGAESVVHAFKPWEGDAGIPLRGLIEASDGRLYGTTNYGGQYLAGTVYRIDPAAIVPVTSIDPTSGSAAGGTAITISGQQFQSGASIRIGLKDVPDPLVSSATAIMATTPSLPPGMLHHVFVMNPDRTEGSLGKAFFADFLDVPQADFFHPSVEKIFRDGITAGCGNGSYCRNSLTSRAQMAVFLLKSLLGRFYYPPPATGTVFTDVPADSFAAAFIEDLAARGVTAGCGDDVYCPSDYVTRAQMAVFLLRTLFGSSYVAPAAVGIFADVPAGSFAADWIEDLYARGITAGCSSSELLYCPDAHVTRGQMAAFLVATFNLP